MRYMPFAGNLIISLLKPKAPVADLDVTDDRVLRLHWYIPVTSFGLANVCIFQHLVLSQRYFSISISQTLVSVKAQKTVDVSVSPQGLHSFSAELG